MVFFSCVCFLCHQQLMEQIETVLRSLTVGLFLLAGCSLLILGVCQSVTASCCFLSAFCLVCICDPDGSLEIFLDF